LAARRAWRSRLHAALENTITPANLQPHIDRP
jgi:hypothetical protein